ncbi:hypothetical protein GCM10017781_04720 [Deinococcus metalli]|uniref:Cytochrome c domain-containing protein n=1 Tax=Deinococcus metalli TaxID=1141878 RepID=A0ABQ3JI01_9DEIO|nr:hypothetical protein GCM10017781_04720 [Deinococcus metalli]
MAAQVKAGLAVYARNCQGCHGDKQQGGIGPALVGAQILKDFTGPAHPYADLHGYVSKAMPLSAPGSLSAQQYLDVVAFLFNVNGVALPADGLTKDTLKSAALTARAAQVQAGQAVFAKSCQGCHGDQLQGVRAPTLLGAAFLKKWATVGDLHAKVSKTMPKNAPGSLSAQQYLDVVAFVLDRNKAAAGSAALGSDDLKMPLK